MYSNIKSYQYQSEYPENFVLILLFSSVKIVKMC